MIGIVALALMTTYLTINLFWRLDDVKLNKEILYDKNFLKLQFKNQGRAICDMKATFALYDEFTSENLEEPKEYYMPILLKKSIWNLRLDLNETFWYKTVYDLLSCSDKKLYCIFSFVDTQTGQNSIKVEEITKENLKMTNKLLELQDFIEPTILSCRKLLPIENAGKLELENQENDISMKYSFPNKATDDSFVMAYYNLHEPNLNLEKYNRETTYLELKLKSENDIRLNFELKLSNGNVITKYIEINSEAKTIHIELKNIEGNLEQVKEICYTIFKKDNKLEGKLEIGDLRIITR